MPPVVALPLPAAKEAAWAVATYFSIVSPSAVVVPFGQNPPRPFRGRAIDPPIPSYKVTDPK